MLWLERTFHLQDVIVWCCFKLAKQVALYNRSWDVHGIHDKSDSRSHNSFTSEKVTSVHLLFTLSLHWAVTFSCSHHPWATVQPLEIMRLHFLLNCQYGEEKHSKDVCSRNSLTHMLAKGKHGSLLSFSLSFCLFFPWRAIEKKERSLSTLSWHPSQCFLMVSFNSQVFTKTNVTVWTDWVPWQQASFEELLELSEFQIATRIIHYFPLFCLLMTSQVTTWYFLNLVMSYSSVTAYKILRKS